MSSLSMNSNIEEYLYELANILEKLSNKNIENKVENFLSPELGGNKLKNISETLSDINKSSKKKQFDSEIKIPHSKSNRNILEQPKGYKFDFS